MSNADKQIRVEDKIYLHKGFRDHYDTLSKDEQIEVDEFVKSLSKNITRVSENLRTSIFNNDENIEIFVKDLDNGLAEVIDSVESQDIDQEESDNI